MRKVSFLFILLLVLCAQFIYAQSAATDAPVEMADALRSNGKIYVVVGVVLIILAGLLIYLISIDRKIGKIEKEIEEGKKE